MSYIRSVSIIPISEIIGDSYEILVTDTEEQPYTVPTPCRGLVLYCRTPTLQMYEFLRLMGRLFQRIIRLVK